MKKIIATMMIAFFVSFLGMTGTALAHKSDRGDDANWKSFKHMVVKVKAWGKKMWNDAPEEKKAKHKKAWKRMASNMKAAKSKACDKASDMGKSKANKLHSRLATCEPDNTEPPPPAPTPEPVEEPAPTTTEPAPTTTEPEPQPSATCDGSDPFNPACM
ncbi:exported hypothetical protein [Nitrospina gracilis 3/211]|uniref:Uncharacterized protein n=1 Tax=Nitrospina gracilis (strain 3/211) TaxID=1266370 RepID=M1YJK1_NITG3|nr:MULTISPECIES: hypothetical protein [Nitrospina]MCF8723573.1 hypothetical protein [Nitrospina sp. Nb-3]CCQ90647.1 exported hypothetical protein [Nitrospina gracilis 3/211]